MEGLIPVVNKLQDVFNTIGKRQPPPLDLPQIVVIGSQSSGKSSVLENIVGKGFLPRGAGICTRRPLVLQLCHTTNSKEEWAEFLHIPDHKFYNFDEVRREIEVETDRETGKNKGISPKAIRLKVYSPHLLDVTLVDLPGITKVPVGDQPSNIEDMVRAMCLEYVSNPLSIILAVSPANMDLANSDALKLAREVDPQGDRTIGVLTKLDLVDDGVDALDALSGRVIPLKRGYIGIVNRSQAEINANVSIKEVRRKEQAFFLNHPSYRSIANRHGTEFLTKTLNSILLSHIREHLPDMKMNLQQQLREVERELQAFGSEPVDMRDKTAQGQLILGLLSKYSTFVIESIEGRQQQQPRFNHHNIDNDKKKLYGGARLARAFKLFSDRLLYISPFQDLTDSDIGTAIMNATGPRPSLFVPELSFEMLVKRQLVYLQEPAMNCVTEVYEILQEVAEQSTFGGLKRFKKLQDHILESVNNMLAKSLIPTQSMIENLIHIEQAFINTSHPDFTNKLQFIRNGNEPPNTSPSSAASVASMGSVENFNHNKRKPSTSSSVDNMDNHSCNNNDDDHDDDDDGENLQQQQQDDDQMVVSRKSNFMSFIFNERTATAKTATTTTTTTKSLSMPVSQFAKKAGLFPPEASTYCVETESDSQIRIIKKLIESYLAISKKNILDLTPKTIMFFLVNHMKENIHTELIRSLYKEQLFDALLTEDEHIAITRNNLKETANLLRKAMAILSEVHQYKI